MNNLITILKGGRGSGDFGHVGRAGKRGGSGGGGGKGKPRKGRRSREALDKEIENIEKMRHFSVGDVAVLNSWPEGNKVTILGPSDHASNAFRVREEDGSLNNRFVFELEKADKKLEPNEFGARVTHEIGKSKRKDDNKTMTVYHATSTDVVDSILDKGLLRSPGSDFHNIPRGVYFSPNKETSIGYGEAYGPEKFAMIEFEIPRDLKNKVHVDEHDRQKYETMDAFYYEDNIPAEWITKVRIFEEDLRKKLGYTEVQIIAKQATGIAFSIVKIDDPNKKKNKTLKDVNVILAS